MKKRSINIRLLTAGLFLIGAVLVFATQLLAPLEQVVVRLAGSFLLGYDRISYVVGRAPMEAQGIRVIGKRSDEFQNTFLVQAKLTVGTKIVSDNVLIGIVDNVSGDISKVAALSSPYYTFDAVFERSGIPIKPEGKGAGVMQVVVPRGSDVVLGDRVLYSDSQKSFFVGVVGKIDDIPSNPFLTIFIVSPVNLATLMSVQSAP